jgi:hypothetical protein
MQSIASTRPSSTSTQCNHHDDVTCTTRRHGSSSLEVRLGNPSLTCFMSKQVSRAEASHQILTRIPRRPPSIDFMTQLTNRSPLGFESQTKKPLRWFWDPNHQTGSAGFEAQIGKPSTLILRLNQETRAPRLHVHDANRTWHHPTSRSPCHRVSDMCLTIPSPLHQVSYSCRDLYRCSPCRTCHLYTTRQATMILHMKYE